jgi:hypothetical protein
MKLKKRNVRGCKKKKIHKWQIPRKWINTVSVGKDANLPVQKGRGAFIKTDLNFIFFLFTTASSTAVGPTQPPIQWVQGAVPGREADHSPPSSAQVKE